MNITQKSIIDDISNILTKFGRTDDSRLNDVWLAHKINQVRADLICKEYEKTENIDQSWLSNLGLVSFYSVNFADDSTVDFCNCDISKTTLPQIIKLPTKSINQDLGIYSMISACGKTRYYNRSINQWRYIPAEHDYSKFHYYSRINSEVYVNKKVDQLRIIAILANPEDAILTNSKPVASGGIVSGVVYLVRGGQVIYNSTIYNDGDTFTGTATATYTGDGKVYLNSQIASYKDTDPYPVSADMARSIVLEICAKEFGLEKTQITDKRNDSEDDTQKS